MKKLFCIVLTLVIVIPLVCCGCSSKQTIRIFDFIQVEVTGFNGEGILNVEFDKSQCNEAVEKVVKQEKFNMFCEKKLRLSTKDNDILFTDLITVVIPDKTTNYSPFLFIL